MSLISPQVSITIQMIQTMSKDEVNDFAALFSKIHEKPVSKPKRKNEALQLPPVEVLVQQALAHHRRIMKKKHETAQQML